MGDTGVRAPARPVVVALGMSLAAIVSIQFGSAVGVSAFDRVGPAGMTTLRLGAGALALVAVVRPSLRGRSAADLRLVLAFGVCIAVLSGSMYQAISRVPLGVAVSISFLGPLCIAVAGSRRALDLAWPALAALGVVLLVDPTGGSADLVGIGFALVGAANWALYILLSPRAATRFGGADGLALAVAVAAVLLAPIGVVASGDELLDPGVLAIGVATGVLTIAVAFRLETEALRRVSTRVFGIFTSLEPAVAVLAGIAILGQSLGARELLGMALVMTASAGASLVGRDDRARGATVGQP